MYETTRWASVSLAQNPTTPLYSRVVASSLFVVVVVAVHETRKDTENEKYSCGVFCFYVDVH